ncbi:hypothetical protein FEM48_Zijuj06G0110300 [Ziziphus jujuba var. spinosa]|uniref:JmjC domain-containing protein n=1 Tax=Ziziphus jujuba var. spinosa TaxID=714518 RepID=A0A978V8W7_ZIZJJ|nr:hypothetical protein FEM48_Zijuj06G0110300 [Ziziphus jujuba var. spinosa]
MSEVQPIGPTDRRPGALGDLRVLTDELICAILEYLSPRDVARLACVSSVMYILCNEEPLWMTICLQKVKLKGPLQYKGSWKKTALHFEHPPSESKELCRKPLQFDGFSSWFLHRRLYRCYTTLGTFSFDNGNVERKKDPPLQGFHREYDGKKPGRTASKPVPLDMEYYYLYQCFGYATAFASRNIITLLVKFGVTTTSALTALLQRVVAFSVLLTGLADAWPARHTWTVEHLLLNYGDTEFKISQRISSKILMKFKDYVSYMKLQHDEDPLYIFDDKFGEIAPGLLKDYSVPHLFQEDFFDILDRDQRPPFRWLIIGPERSGASWHVDPALTSAWNTLLCGRKRWALYPPGKVPAGVTVHVNDEDGDVNIESPSSLQWWLDFYPLLPDEDKPIECTQMPGETIFVPSGWWHCVLNLETTIAVTQNFVNSRNFEFVCLDMAPGYLHKGVCRAGLLALDGGSFDDIKENISYDEDGLSYSDLTRKEKRVKILKPGEDLKSGSAMDTVSKYYNLWKEGFSYDINFLFMFLDKERDHYNFPWSSGNCMGQREMREWLYKLWVGKPGMRELIWKGASLALNAGRWLECLVQISAFHNLPSPTEFERLPVGTGSNPVYLMSDCVIKIFVEDGPEASFYGLGTELEFYSLLRKANSPLQNHIPQVLASGILYCENGSYKIVPWDGSSVPDVIAKCNFLPEKCNVDVFPLGIWSKKHFEYRKAGISMYESNNSARFTRVWPYIITKRCKGKIFAQLRERLLWDDVLSLASFLGEQLRNLHLLPHPPCSIPAFSDIEQQSENGFMKAVPYKSSIPTEWDTFIRTLMRMKKDVLSRLSKWGDPIPSTLIEKVDEYIPNDLAKLLYVFEDENEGSKVCKPFCWVHSDIMDDNIHMEPYANSSCFSGSIEDDHMQNDGSLNGCGNTIEGKSWHPSHILDFSDLSLG